MHDAYMPIVEIEADMILGAGTWLDAVARNADLLYGMAHRPDALFSQAWQAPTAVGARYAWEGETVYDGVHANFNFSAWVNVISGGSAILQLYYADSWHDFVADTNAGEHWFDDAEDTDGVIVKDISTYYSVGNVVRARMRIDNGTDAWIYRACLGGFAPEWPDGTSVEWPTFPTWQEVSPHGAADFNTLRSACEYLRQAAQRPLLGEECAEVTHRSGGSQILARWALRKAGTDKLTVVIESTGCDASNYIKLFWADEQYPHGPNTVTTHEITAPGGIITNTTTTISFDMATAGLSIGTYYSILLQTTGSARAKVTSIHVADLAGEARADVPGVFAHGDIPSAADLQAIGDDLEDMKPTGPYGSSPVWYEHTFSTYRGFVQDCQELDPLSLVEITGRRWRFWHTFDFLRYRGAGKVVSQDGAYTYSLPDSNPAGGAQVFDLRSLAWLASGDWYYVEDSGGQRILTAYEDWQA